ncbi:MAG: GTPase ObgE [Deltaproteobacteria bacterium]|nr:GTPase ObgE [Deltaproteobacteria bacterium]
MDFLDEALITAKSGDGGRGCVSFRRERFIPKGGPDGGDGGKGGDVIVRATRRLDSLVPFRYRRFFRAQKGQPGRGQKQSGKDGKDVVVEVPPGTTVQDPDTGEPLADLVLDNQELVLLKGGRGGWGNQHFATSTNRAPRRAQPGLPGQEKRFRLVLKTVANIGLIGLPNAGKSTLLSHLTTARPKIADYPFTTLVPNLGVIVFDEGKTLTVADIPGLIEGASEGRGLGHRFLKHIERTEVLLHLLDITHGPVSGLMEDFDKVTCELEAYSPSLPRKQKIVLINKIDLSEPGHRDVAELIKRLKARGYEAFPISALTGQGLEDVKRTLLKEFFHEDSEG